MRCRIPITVVVLSCCLLVRAEESSYRDAALRAAAWIRTTAVQTGDGTVWPADPEHPEVIPVSLYSGTSGVVLFFLEAYRATHEKSYLEDATAGADYLLAVLDRQTDPGLYTGVAGIGFTLSEVFKVTRGDRYRRGVRRCMKFLDEWAEETMEGIRWSETTDIISGSAGIGLFLLYAGEALKETRPKELAIEAGHQLMAVSQSEASGLKWSMDSEYPRLMPNFSHGTAGVAYFLATLYGETNRKVFLDAAVKGARYLQSVADTTKNSCLIFHHQPGGEDLFYLSWCHGPPGTARLFYQLYRVTGHEEWMTWVNQSARAVLMSGIPQKRTTGYWNNVGQCCGDTGVAQFFLGLFSVTREQEYLSFAKKVTDHILSKATAEKGGFKWIQAEHRIRPELLIAQTGFMQGAAGIGIHLLHMDRLELGKRHSISLPDSPF